MIQLKCRCCLSDSLKIVSKEVAECEACGQKMLLPSIEDDTRNELLNSGNKYRNQYEFDLAINEYEEIVKRDPTDAEAHFELALAKYGVEYILDEKRKIFIPTCHRINSKPFTEDLNYRYAIQYASEEFEPVYTMLANDINRTWESIKSISYKEVPYDVFICYKESKIGEDDNSGQNRTPDSFMAQEIYNELTARGLNVFFSRVTLMKHAAQDYEAYIFGALQSAKVMLVVGTSNENVNAIWVKNEWNRFISFRKKNAKKNIISVLGGGFRKNNLPLELQSFPAHSFDEEDNEELYRSVLKMTGNMDKSIQYLKNRELEPVALQLLETGEFDKAKDVAERILNFNTESKVAHQVLFLAEREAKTITTLAYQDEDVTLLPEFKRVKRYASEVFLSELEEFYDIRRKREFYVNGSKCLEDKKYKNAWINFARAEDYSDAVHMASKGYDLYDEDEKRIYLERKAEQKKSELEQNKKDYSSKCMDLNPAAYRYKNRLMNECDYNGDALDKARLNRFIHAACLVFHGLIMILWANYGDLDPTPLSAIGMATMFGVLIFSILNFFEFSEDWPGFIKGIISGVVGLIVGFIAITVVGIFVEKILFPSASEDMQIMIAYMMISFIFLIIYTIRFYYYANADYMYEVWSDYSSKINRYISKIEQQIHSKLDRQTEEKFNKFNE